jgi:hypothetical protein
MGGIGTVRVAGGAEVGSRGWGAAVAGGVGGRKGVASAAKEGVGGDGVCGTDVGVAGVTTAVADATGRAAVGVAAINCAGRGAGSARAGAVVGSAAARVAVGTTTVTNPRITASIVLSGVGWGSGVGNDWARALLPQPVRRISARTKMDLDNPVLDGAK